MPAASSFPLMLWPALDSMFIELPRAGYAFNDRRQQHQNQDPAAMIG